MSARLPNELRVSCRRGARLAGGVALLTLALTPGIAAAQQKSSDDVYDDAPAAGAAPSDEARTRFKKGLALTAAGKVAEALVEFQGAYDLSPNWKILYNVGQCSKHVGDHARALAAFERYLAEGRDQVQKPRRAEVEKEIAELEGLVGTIELVTAAAGAEVELDGKGRGKAPLAEPLVVTAGRHKLALVKEGATPATKEIDVARGANVKVELDFAGAPAASGPVAAPNPAPAEPDGGRRDHSTWITVGWIATGAFVVGAGVTGTLALVMSSDVADTAYAGPYSTAPPDLQSKASTVDTLAIVTDVLGGAAILGAGATIYLMITNDGPAPPKTGGGGLAVGLAPGGASLRGTF